MLEAYHRISAEAIAAHGGRMLLLYGDGALACFGLSQDAENAALAAVTAMLEIVRAVPRALDGVEVRVGVHSGTVLYRPQTEGSLAAQITGLDVNIAARVQGLAPPGGVVATATTMGFLARSLRSRPRIWARSSSRAPRAAPGLYDRGPAVRAAAARAGALFERDALLVR